MLPIIVDGSRTEIALIGRGPDLARRLGWLIAGGARRLTVYTDDPAALRDAEVAVIPRLPLGDELGAVRLVWITGLSDAEAAPRARAARVAGVLCNVEDRLSLCDFHTPSVVRRGDLLLTVSTGGKSPGLAQQVRVWLERQFGPEWAVRLEVIAGKRTAWRRRARPLPKLAALTAAVVTRHGWLPSPTEPRP